jgi:LacI family transcriptional regulator
MRMHGTHSSCGVRRNALPFTTVPASAPHPTQADVARAAGVSQPTVSRVLRGVGQLTDATSKKIRRIARQLGYEPDPLLSALTHRRHDQAERRPFHLLAYVFNGPSANGWSRDSEHRAIFDAARRRAEELGWKMEPFWATAPHLTPTKASRQLVNRGIKGLIIAPLHSAHDHLELEWEHFCAVAIGRSLVAPRLHRVAANLYGTTHDVAHELVQRGYRHVGVVVRRASAERTDYVLPAAFQGFAQNDPRLRMTLLALDDWQASDRAQFSTWLKRVRPDVVFAEDITALRWLRALRFRVPQDIGFALNHTLHPGVAGISGNVESFGRLVTDWLSTVIRRNETGVPAIRHSLMVEDVWREGRTLRPRAAI